MSEATQEKTPFWLKDNFAPVFEERTEASLNVIGQIPEQLNGTLMRNGANPQSCLLYTSPSPRDRSLSRMPSSA